MNNRNSNAKKNSMCSSIASEMSMASTTSTTSTGSFSSDGGDYDEQNTSADASIDDVSLAVTGDTNNKTRKNAKSYLFLLQKY